uniref:Uncharacterized protein n=1 Tax=Glossina palpalis gambiensis TaxID=67801 RepID=A0A1B0B0N2_9MUSC
MNGKGLIVRGKHGPTLNQVSDDAENEEVLARKEMYLPVWLFFSRPFQKSDNKQIIDCPSLPEDIQVISLESFTKTKSLFSLEYVFCQGNSLPISIHLKRYLKLLHAKEVHETALDGNKLLRKMKRLKFQRPEFGMEKLEYYKVKLFAIRRSELNASRKYDLQYEERISRTSSLS